MLYDLSQALKYIYIYIFTYLKEEITMTLKTKPKLFKEHPVPFDSFNSVFQVFFDL